MVYASLKLSCLSAHSHLLLSHMHPGLAQQNPLLQSENWHLGLLWENKRAPQRVKRHCSSFSQMFHSSYFCVTQKNKNIFKIDLIGLSFPVNCRTLIVLFSLGCPEKREFCSTLAFCFYFQQWLLFHIRHRVKLISNRKHHRITRLDATGDSTVQLPCSLPLTHTVNSVNWTNQQNTANSFNSRILTSSSKYVLAPADVHPLLPFIS